MRRLCRCTTAATDAAVVYCNSCFFIPEMMEQHFEVKGRRRGSWRRDIYVFFSVLFGRRQRARARELPWRYSFFILFPLLLFLLMRRRPLSELSVCAVRVMSKTLLDAHPCYRRRLCRPATAAATAPAALAQRFGSPNYCEFAITLFRWCGGEDGMNGALLLSLTGSDGQIES